MKNYISKYSKLPLCIYKPDKYFNIEDAERIMVFTN